MRTKRILTVAAGVLCAASAMAVTSVNVVGYVNVNLVSGFNLVAPPLQGADNAIATILPSVPNGTTVQKWDSVNQAFFDPLTYDTDIYGGWDVPTALVTPGEAVFINVVNPATLTFVGDVRQGNLTTPLVAGFSMVGSQVPQTGGLTTPLGFTPNNGDTVQQWDAVNQKYKDPSTYDTDIYGGWDIEPNLGMAEGCVITRLAPGTWARNFTVQ